MATSRHTLTMLRSNIFATSLPSHVLLWVVLCACWLYAAEAKAAELQVAQLTQASGAYILRTEVMVEAPARRVRSALVDYENLPSLNPNIESVEILERGSDWLRVALRTKTCVLLFCQRFEWVQRVTTAPNGDIVAVVEPHHGDLRRGVFRYSFVEQGKNSLLITQAEVEPRARVPSGRMARGILKNLLGHEAVTLSSRLERELAASLRLEPKSPS